MRIFPLTALAVLCLSAIAGCSTTGLPRLVPRAEPPIAASIAPGNDICLAWQQALNGYDAAGERRRLADMLRARGEDPARCERPVAGKEAVPLSASAVSGPATVARETGRRPARAEVRRTTATGRRPIDARLTCSSELVKGPPDRYKTICR